MRKRYPELEAPMHDVEAQAADQVNPIVVLALLLQITIRSEADPYMLIRGYCRDDCHGHPREEANRSGGRGHETGARSAICAWRLLSDHTLRRPAARRRSRCDITPPAADHAEVSSAYPVSDRAMGSSFPRR